MPMPQILSNYGTPTILKYGSNVLTECFPEIALKVMETIATHAHSDALIDQMIIYLMGAEPRLGFAALDALKSTDARRSAFLGIAEEALPKDDFFLIQAIFKVTQKSRARRNNFAHGLWGQASTPNDAAILIPAAAITKALATDREKDLTGPEGKQNVASNPAQIDPSLCYAYSLADAEQSAKEARKAYTLIGDLTLALYVRAMTSSAMLLDGLKTLPEVAPALQKFRPTPTT
jgi:hypothetical protein